jgi:hypothetical protein
MREHLKALNPKHKMYSSISKHDGVNYSRKLSELRKINPNPAPISHDSLSHEQVLATTDPPGKSKKGIIILAGVIIVGGFFAFRFIKAKKNKPVARTRAPLPPPLKRDPRIRNKPQWVVQLAVLLGIGVIAGGTWIILKKSGKYDF